MSTAKIELSGYLGGDRVTNVPALGEHLAAAFEKKRAEHDDTAILIPVVGMLRVETMKVSRDPDVGPTIALRFAALEAAPEGRETEVRELYLRLRDTRLGDQPLDLDWTGRGPRDNDEPEDDGADNDPDAAYAADHPGTSTSAVDFQPGEEPSSRGKRQ